MATDPQDPPPTATNQPAGAELQREELSETLAAEQPAPVKAGNRTGHAVKDALLAGLIALALFGPIVGFETTAGASYALTAVPRWGLLAIMVAAVVVGRFLLSVFIWNPQRQGGTTIGAAIANSKAISSLSGFASIIFLLLAVAIPFLVVYMAPMHARYVLGVGTLIITYVMLGWGLNIVVGLAGLLDLGYVAFYAVGAYSYALLATTFGWSFWICLPLAGILAAFWGIILGFPVLRLRGDYLAIVTLAFGEIIRLVLINWVAFTNGPNGINRIPRPSFFGLDFSRDADGFAAFFGLAYSPDHRIIFLYFLILVLALITNFFTLRIRNLPIGRAWEALREDEIACRSLGINTTNTKLTAFAIGAMFGGFAGSFFATRQGFISPESFNFMESATILAIVVLGGLGSQLGIAVAAVVMIGGIELLRNLSLLKQVFGQDFDPSNYRLIIFGLVMVGIMVWRPRGLVSTRKPSVFLKSRKTVSGDLISEGHG